MNIYEYLKKDHQTADALIEKVVANKNEEQREELYNKISHELAVHSEAEEETFYKAIVKNGDEEAKKEERHYVKEHDEIREHLKKLDAMDVHDESWMSLFHELKKSVDHHVREEESKTFDRAKKIISESEAEELAKKMDAYKKNKTSSQHAA